MVRGKILKALSRMENFLIEKPSQAWKLAKGVGEAGSRATPPRNQIDDRRLGVRLDWGEELKKDGKTLRRIKLQLNSMQPIKLSEKQLRKTPIEYGLPLISRSTRILPRKKRLP
ncbi:hypothetical protein HL42_7346 [Trichophyton rubrum]|nr:hypothetical protein HL42_7346 [Trichophyton rubrum]